MVSQLSESQVHAWTAVGLMTPEAVFARLDQAIIDSSALHVQERAALKANFAEFCNVDGRVDEATFTAFALAKLNLPSALTSSVQVLFSSLCYLSIAPLAAAAPSQAYLTIDGVIRALIWAFPSRISGVLLPNLDHRIRTIADHRRLLFQSLATPLAGSTNCSVVDSTKVYAASKDGSAPHDKTANPCEPSECQGEDGDGTYQDVVDVLLALQPFLPVGYSGPSRDAFRVPATELHKGAVSLSSLSISKDRLEAFVTLLLATNFEGAVLDYDEDLKSVTKSIAGTFIRDSGRLDLTSWPGFKHAMSENLPHMLEALYHLLNVLFLDGRNPSCDGHVGHLPRSTPESLLTLPRMAQIESFLFDSICLPSVHRFQTYDLTNSGSPLTTATVFSLLAAMEAIPEAALLLISGLTETSQACVFGVFVARPLEDGPCIQPGGSSFGDTAILFQLLPVHDVFRGTMGTPAWTVTEEEGNVAFGSEGAGAALTLHKDLGGATFTYCPVSEPDAGVYRHSRYRQEVRLNFRVEKIELWGEKAEHT